MLSANYGAIGIGYVHVPGSYYKWYWTTNFGGYADAAPEACSALAPSAQAA